MTLLDHGRRPALGDTVLDDADALIEEARKRHRRRRRFIVGVLLLALVCAGVVTALVAEGGFTSHTVSSVQDQPKPGAPPPGRIVALEKAGPLALSATGELYVADERRHEVLVRLSDGKFRVVAGDGTSGTAGNGGAAIGADLSNVSDLAFGPNGNLYIADGARVQVVDGAGTIHTVAGGGTEVPGPSGTPALSASLRPAVASIAFSRSGKLYLATPSELFELTSQGTLRKVRAVVATGVTKGQPLGSFGQIAVGSDGDVYVSSLARGWSAYEITPGGKATYLGYARRDGGAPANLATGPGGFVEVGTGSSIMGTRGNKLTTNYTFASVPGTQWFTLDYFASAPGGVVYADDLGDAAFQPLQQLVEVRDGHPTVLWQHPNR